MISQSICNLVAFTTNMSNDTIDFTKHCHHILPPSTQGPRNIVNTSTKSTNNKRRVRFQPEMRPVIIISNFNSTHSPTKLSIIRVSMPKRFSKSENKIGMLVTKNTSTRRSARITMRSPIYVAL
ncbi:hypothetical protein QL285_039327 [Trifolium repens]|nr:hypothetical protein QL285_039327 [Trifolium repens]